MAAQVHQRAAAGLLDVPEPVGVRAGVLLALLDEVDVAERALVRHLLRLHVLRREEQLLGVHEEHALRRGRRRSSRRPPPASRRAASRRRRACRRARRRSSSGVQPVRRRDRDHLDVRLAQQLAVVGDTSAGCRSAARTPRRCPASARRPPPPRPRRASAGSTRSGTSAWNCEPMIPTLTLPLICPSLLGVRLSAARARAGARAPRRRRRTAPASARRRPGSDW